MNNIVVMLNQIMPEGRVFALDMQTVLSIGVQLLNAIILAVVLGFILYKPVLEFMNKRTDKIKNQIDEAAATMLKANETIVEYENKIANIEKERIEILEASHVKSELERKKILDKANDEVNEIKKRAVERIEEDRKNMNEATRVHIIDLASVIAEKYIAGNINKETLERLFDETLTQLEGSEWKK